MLVRGLGGRRRLVMRCLGRGWRGWGMGCRIGCWSIFGGRGLVSGLFVCVFVVVLPLCGGGPD